MTDSELRETLLVLNNNLNKHFEVSKKKSIDISKLSFTEILLLQRELHLRLLSELVIYTVGTASLK